MSPPLLLRAATLGLVLCALALVGHAQEGAPRRVELRVTSVVGSSVFVDGGRDLGIEPGDEARVLPLGGLSLPGVVRAVSTATARIELLDGAVAVDVGTTVEVLASNTPTVPPGDVGPSTGAESALPWTAGPVVWDESQPLLAPIEAPGPADRPVDFNGRTFLGTQWIENRAGEEQLSYGTVRAGLVGEWTNILGKGGALQASLRGFVHAVDVGGGASESADENRLWVNRLNYGIGDDRERPTYWRAGRFLQTESPEFGVLDGVEYGRRRKGGDRWSLGLGYQPEVSALWNTGKDLQVSGTYRWVNDPAERVAARIGFAKSWHEGVSDRDLILTGLELRPGDATSLVATTWVDWYDSNAVTRDEGFELTQVQVGASHRFGQMTGVGLNYSYVRWPELLRNDYPDATLEEIASYRVGRTGLSAWHRVSERVRVSGRADFWNDQDASGVSGDVQLGLRDVLWKRGTLTTTLFRADGKFSNGLGLRLRADRALGTGSLGGTYEVTDYEQQDFSGSQSNLLQQVFRLGYSWTFGRHWNATLDGETRFGDQQGSVVLGFLIQRRW